MSDGSRTAWRSPERLRRGAAALLALVALAGASGCATTSGQSWSSWGTSLDTWIDGELNPYLEEQLASHPRFKGEPVIFVAVPADSRPGEVDGLSASIRDRMAYKLMKTPGVRVVSGSARPVEGTGLTCAPGDTAHYQIQVELESSGGGRAEVRVRAYDREDRTWVSGFGLSWEGVLTNPQRRLARLFNEDEGLRGQRELPFDAGQTDLLAAFLAHKVSCELRGYDYSELVVYTDTGTEDSGRLAGAPELVGSNLVNLRAATVTDDPSRANLILRGKAHQIEKNLYQYWVMIRPAGESAYLPSVESAVYVRLPGDSPVIAAREPSVPARAVSPNRKLLSPVRVIRPVNQHYCEGRDPWRHGVRRPNARFGIGEDECFGIEVELYRNAHLFVLNHRADATLTRVDPGGCGAGGIEGYARGRGKIRFPGEERAFEAFAPPGLETFYAVAVADPESAQRLGEHLSLLPSGCGSVSSAGLGGADLEVWLDELDTLLAQLRPGVDWRAVRVRHRN